MANMTFGVNIIPSSNNTYTLGNSDKKWNIYAENINGAAPLSDVKIDNSSIVTNGVANIPVATATQLGLVKVNVGFSGIGLSGSNVLYLESASEATIKTGTNYILHSAVDKQHVATFYGLAKAAGDTTQSVSDNSVGTYTDSAKSSIRSMLGTTSPDIIAIQDTQPTSSDTKLWLPETAPTGIEVPTYSEFTTALNGKVSDVQVNGTSVVSNGVANISLPKEITISETTPVINAIENTRYFCGELTSLTFTPCSTGMCEIIFSSGATATTLVIPNTVKWSNNFDSTNLQSNAVYEINILNGVYGVVAAWT